MTVTASSAESSAIFASPRKNSAAKSDGQKTTKQNHTQPPLHPCIGYLECIFKKIRMKYKC